MLIVEPPAEWEGFASGRGDQSYRGAWGLGLSGTAARNTALYFPGTSSLTQCVIANKIRLSFVASSREWYCRYCLREPAQARSFVSAISGKRFRHFGRER